MRVAYVHDWLVTYRGGEKVLDALLELYPQAPIYTLFHDERAMPASINEREIIVPRGLRPLRQLRKALLPLLPSIIESFPMQEFDLVISTSSCVAKGIIPGPNTIHLCYLHSPMRYAWDQRFEYLTGLRKIPLAATATQYLSSSLRTWDVASSHRVDHYFVNSSFVGQRVSKYYGRHDSEVLAPPIELDRFEQAQQAPRLISEPYFLAAGAMVGYKRFDLAIQAAEAAGKRLVVAGNGPARAQLQRLAGPNTTFEIAPANDRWDSLLAHAEALLFPGIEDFGMIAIEAMAAGTPVIAAAQGGALDFIEPGRTGQFFPPNDVESLTALLRTYHQKDIDLPDVAALRDSYGRERFLETFRQQIAAATSSVATP